MQEAKGIRAVGIHHGVQIDLADALEGPHQKRILGQEFARRAALHMPLPKTRVGFLDGGDLLRREVDGFACYPFFELEEPLKARPNAMLDEDALNRGATHRDALQLQMRREPHTAPGRMRQRERHNLLSNLRRSRLRMRLVDWRQVFETLQPLL